MIATLVETRAGEHACLHIQTEHLSVEVLPEIGAKVLSLLWKPSGREHLWRQPGRELRRPYYGAPFDQYDISGWDECFPSIGEVHYPDGPWKGIIVPDHGELWSQPWQWEWRKQTLRMWVDSVRFGYHFERSLDFAGSDHIAIHYRVANPTPFPFRALWSMHPFFTVSPSSRVLLPSGVSVVTELSMGDRAGPYLSRNPWPMMQDQSVRDGSHKEIDLSIMGPRHQNYAEKLFSTLLPEGWSALYDAATGEFIAFTFDPTEVPFMGICQIRDGWPSEGESAFTTILEPCTGWPDRLDVAAERGAHQVIPARGEKSWRVILHIGQGKEALQSVIGEAIAL
jgi:hypothetical protein